MQPASLLFIGTIQRPGHYGPRQSLKSHLVLVPAFTHSSNARAGNEVFVVPALPWAPRCCPTASLRQSEQMQQRNTVSGNEKEANCFLKPNYHLKTAAASCEPFCSGLLGRQQVLVEDTETGSSKRLALGRLDSTFQEAYRGKCYAFPFKSPSRSGKSSFA